MIKIDEHYSDYRDDNDPNYPGGKAVDAPHEESFEGTPYLAEWMNDINGFRQALHVAAYGSIDTINNEPDNANNSDSTKAILKLVNDAVDEVIDNAPQSLNTLRKLAAAKAPLESPVLTGSPTATTAEVDDNSERIATTAFVQLVRAAVKAEIKNEEYPIGKLVIQYPSDKTPAEQGLPGVWEVWSHRAEEYGVANSLPAYTAYVQGGNYSANAYALYTLEGSVTRLIRAKETITNAPAQYDPVKWLVAGDPGFGLSVEYVSRRAVQGDAWADADFETGDIISGGTHNGKRIVDIIALGGKFPSIEGGNRPTFITGGVAGDRIREIWGDTLLNFRPELNWGLPTGAFEWQNKNGTMGTASANPRGLCLRSSLIVPVGIDNSPVTISVRGWRRVA